jgi:hypothetical protein
VTAYATWKFLHILLFVFWLGTDIGVFILAIFIKKAEFTPNQRMLLLRVAGNIDMWPRTAFVLTLPVGMQLSATMGLIGIEPVHLAAIWAFALVWLAIVWGIKLAQGQPMGARLERIHNGLVLLLGALILLVAVQSLAGDALIRADWLSLKVLLYGLICGLAFGIDFAFKPLINALVDLQSEGSSPETESAITRSMNKTLVFVVLIYLAVLLAALIGVVKPH